MKFFLAVFVTLGSILALVVVASETEFGRAQTFRIGSHFLEKQTGLALTVGRTHGSFFSQLEIDDLSLSDDQGLWLESSKIRLVWDPLALRDRLLSIGHLSAKSLQIDRSPNLESEDAGRSNYPLIPDLPVDLELSVLELEDLKLGAALVSEEIRASVEGQLSIIRDAPVKLKLKAKRSDDISGDFDLTLLFDEQSKAFDLDLSLYDGDGGILASLLADPDLPAFSLELRGDGNTDLWKGELAGGSEELGALNGDLQLKAGDRLSLLFDGKLDYAALVPAELSGILGEMAKISFSADYDLKHQNVAVELKDLSNDKFSVSASGGLDEDGQFQPIKAAWVLGSSDALNEMLSPLTLSEASGELLLRQEGEFFTLESKSLAEEVSLPPYRAREAILNLNSGPLGLDAIEENLPFQGNLSLSSPSGLPSDAEAVLGTSPSIEFRGGLEIAGSLVTLKEVLFKGAYVSANASGELSLEPQMLALQGGANLENLELVPSLSAYLNSGSLSTEYQLSFDFEENIELEAEGRLADLGLVEPSELQNLTGREADFTFHILQSSDGLHFEKVQIDSGAVSLALSGRAPEDFASITADYTLSIAELSLIPGLPLSGELITNGEVKGPLDDLKIAGEASTPDLVIQGHSLSSVGINYTLGSLPQSPEGEFKASAFTPWGALSASLGANMSANTVTLRNINVELGQSRMAGDLEIDPVTTTVVGSLTGAIDDLSQWSALIGQEISGNLEYDTRLTLKSAAQNLDMSASIADLQTELGGAESLSLNASLSDLFKNAGTKADITADNAKVAEFLLEKISLSLEGSLTDGVLDVSADSAGPDDFRLKTNLAYLIEGSKTSISVNSFESTVFEQELKLEDKLVITRDTSFWEISDGRVLLKDGRVELGGKLKDDRVNAYIDAIDIPVELLTLLHPDFPFSGPMSIRAKLEGSTRDPKARIELAGNSLQVSDPTSTAREVLFPDVELASLVDLSSRSLSASGEVSGFTDKAITFQVNLPLRFALDPFTLDISENESISAQAGINGRLGPLAALFLQEEHRLEGTIEGELMLSGSLSSPRFGGSGRIYDGAYENLATGTLLKNLSAVFEGEGSQIELVSLEASGPRRGRLSASGGLAFLPGQIPQLDINTEISGLFLMRRDDISVAVEGNTRIYGSLDKLLLEGRLRTTTAEIEIQRVNASTIQDLQVIEVNGPEETNGQSASQGSGGAVLALDLKLIIPNRAFVRSTIMDTEWSGELLIKGTSEEPRITGVLRPVRGQIQLAERRFRVEDGSISFEGGTPDPVLDLAAVHRRSNFEARILVKGRASEPELELTSSPEYPDDEIVSRVLFDKPASQLSTSESIELAATLARLTSGIAPAAGVITGIRRSTGLDVLRAGQTEEGDPSLTAGKYVAEGVYVGVDQSTASGSTAATVEVEITPNLSLDGTVGADSQGRLGLRWQWDY